MQALLDTVAIYRAATAPDSLPATVRSFLGEPTNQLFVSMASAWEMAIKSSLGKIAAALSTG